MITPSVARLALINIFTGLSIHLEREADGTTAMNPC